MPTATSNIFSVLVTLEASQRQSGWLNADVP